MAAWRFPGVGFQAFLDDRRLVMTAAEILDGDDGDHVDSEGQVTGSG